MQHPVEIKIGASWWDILEAIGNSKASIATMRGFVGEYLLKRYLQTLKKQGLIENFEQNQDGSKKPDFSVSYQGKIYAIECKTGHSRNGTCCDMENSNSANERGYSCRLYDEGWLDVLATLKDGRLLFLHESHMRRHTKHQGKYHRTQGFDLPWSDNLVCTLEQAQNPVTHTEFNLIQVSIFDLIPS